MSVPSATKEQFFSERNEQMLDRLLYDHVQRRSGMSLDDRQKQRLVKTVKHYMGEVYRVNSTQNIQYLNKETLAAVLPDYTAYLDRGREVETSEKTEVEIVTSSDPLRQDVGTRFALMQDSRNTAKAAPPAPPDFRIPLEEDNSSSAASLFEQAKKQREAEAARTALAVQEQIRPREAGAIAKPKTLENEITTMTVPPDMRALFGMQSQGRTPYEPQGLAQANPTIAVPTVRADRPVLPQDFLQKEEDVLNYKENEYNLFCYSADRDWTVNTGESRYNFSVLFNPGNVTTNNGVRANTSTQVKFRNIVRIELVKALVPVEGIDVLIDRGARSGPVYYNQTIVNTNVLSFPYLMVRVPELDTNSIGTNQNIDSAFGLIQYDANWITDNTNVVQRGGFLGMIPKFMKCQKTYYPTPLATLQKLSIQLQRPDGSLVSPLLDTLDISGFVLSNSIVTITAPTVYPIPNTGTVYAANSAAVGLSQYIWIQTNTWFNTFMFNQGDRIQLKNIAFTSTFTGNAGVAQDFISYLTNPAGLLVVNIGYYSGSAYITGTNSVGYANYIIIDARYNDPTKGYTSVSPFGGVASDTFAGTLVTGGTPPIPANNIIQSGRLINLSHQTHLVFRVITRDMDAASRLRPDNLN